MTGLRLAALSMKHRGEYRSLLPELQGGTQYVMEYLFNENLSHQPTDVRNYLLKTSILDRFCAPLCESLGGNTDESEEDKSSSWQLIRLLKQENLFIISLDAEGHWYRFHHLFQELLQRQLKRDQSPKEIAELHLRASQWYESEGFFKESIKHALAAGDFEHAAEIVERYQHSEISEDRWYVVQQWLQLDPSKPMATVVAIPTRDDVQLAVEEQGDKPQLVDTEGGNLAVGAGLLIAGAIVLGIALGS